MFSFVTCSTRNKELRWNLHGKAHDSNEIFNVVVCQNLDPREQFENSA